MKPGTEWRLYRLAPEASAALSEAISTVRSSVFLASAARPAMTRIWNARVRGTPAATGSRSRQSTIQQRVVSPAPPGLRRAVERPRDARGRKRQRVSCRVGDVHRRTRQKSAPSCLRRSRDRTEIRHRVPRLPPRDFIHDSNGNLRQHDRASASCKTPSRGDDDAVPARQTLRPRTFPEQSTSPVNSWLRQCAKLFSALSRASGRTIAPHRDASPGDPNQQIDGVMCRGCHRAGSVSILR